MAKRKKPTDTINHIKDCGAPVLYVILDPSDTIARWHICTKHNVLEPEYPVVMAVTWPDGKSQFIQFEDGNYVTG